ncbi:MAG: hypothetical protein ACRDJM_01615, partial [Actinomycetota bacterium]
MRSRLFAGIAVGAALAMLGPVLEAVGSYSGGHADPWADEKGTDVQRAAAAEWGNNLDEGYEYYKLSAWRRDEMYAEGVPPARFVDGRITL